MPKFTSRTGSTSVEISEEKFAELVAEFSRRTRGGSESPEQAARGWLLTDAARRADWKNRVDEFTEPTPEEIETEARAIAFSRLTIEVLSESGGCHYNVSDVLRRAMGGHRMSDGMQADYLAAQGKASRLLREYGITDADRESARQQLCADRDYCNHRLGK